MNEAATPAAMSTQAPRVGRRERLAGLLPPYLRGGVRWVSVGRVLEAVVSYSASSLRPSNGFSSYTISIFDLYVWPTLVPGIK